MKLQELQAETIIITHGDIDGMVCAAQLIRREKSNCDLQFSNAKYIASKLQSILKWKSLPKRIYITDIPPNTKAVESVEQLAKNDVEVLWIDHHPWSDTGLMKRLKHACACVVYEEGMDIPAGVLTGRWLKKEDPYYDQIGCICYAYEKGSKWERNWFRLLASYIGKADKKALERLAYDRDFTQDDLRRINSQIESENTSERILHQEPVAVPLNSGKIMAIYDTSKTEGLYLGHKVFEHHDVDYCLIRISKTKWQLACNPSKKYSMKHLMGNKNIGGHVFSLAGRENELLAIESQPAKNLKSKIHELLIDWLCEDL